MTHILGISAFYHDSAACLVSDGKIVAAAQEERFSRRKHDHRFPDHAVAYCLEQAGIGPDDLRYVAFYDKPFLKFERLLETYIAFAPAGLRSFLKAMPLWLKEKLWMSEEIRKRVGYEGELIYPEHHQSHAASAFFPSPYDRAAILTIDGVGEWATASWGIGDGNRIELQSELHFPHSLGLLYSAFTYYTGFRVNSGEYKVMGLAPYGEPRYVDLIFDNLIDLREDGSFWLDMQYFNYCQGLTMTSKKFDKLFGGPPRKPESTIGQKEMDLARSVQVVVEEVVGRMARHVRKETGSKNLCLAGGVALNCVANGKILSDGIFDSIWIQPAAGDAGGALGAALFAWHQVLEQPRVADNKSDVQSGSYLGPSFSSEQIRLWLDEHDIPYSNRSLDDTIEKAADMLADGQVVGWFSGRMEFGPRALGARSILGDPRNSETQTTMNLKIKFRESFRPFAPSCLEEDTERYFDLDGDSPYMLLVAPVAAARRLEADVDLASAEGFDKLKTLRSDIPAVTHVDYSARVQTVSAETAPAYHQVIDAFKRRTGYGVVVNTSFNVRGEPIVCTPQDAYACFMRTNMDALVMEDLLLLKSEQPETATVPIELEHIELD
ncbi:MAG: carbamoyltransferase [Rhodothermia bacterium]